MFSKNKKSQTAAERRYVAMVADLPCSVCDAPGPSEVHEPRQGLWHCAIALCPSCHRDSRLGLHGEKRMWAIRKVDEWDALAVTVRRVMEQR